MSDQTKLRYIFGAAYMSVCVSATKHHSSEAGATDNSQPLSDMTTTTYEQLDESARRPVNYEQLPSQTGQQHEYEQPVNYERPESYWQPVNYERPGSYLWPDNNEQSPSQTGLQHGYYNVANPTDISTTGPQMKEK